MTSLQNGRKGMNCCSNGIKGLPAGWIVYSVYSVVVYSV
jgi:hypothetical protein